MPIPELLAYKRCLGKYLNIEDWQAVDIVLATAVAHKLEGEMLWLRVIGASGSGKTEILRSISAQPGYTESMETITPSSIRRGLQMMKRNKVTGELEKVQKEPTLLELLDGKLVITKELAPLLTRHSDSKTETFGLLRSVHDGELVADYGSLAGRVKQKCRFDWILGTTTYVDSENQLEMQLGSRFTDLRWGSPATREEAMQKAVDNMDILETIRLELATAMANLLAKVSIENIREAEIPYHIFKVADIVAHFRTPVPRDRNTKEILDQPVPELGTRIAQNLAKINRGLIMLGIEDTKSYMARLAWDMIPPVRVCILHAILDLEAKEERVTQENLELQNSAGLSQATISYILKDLRILRINELAWREHLDSNKHLW